MFKSTFVKFLSAWCPRAARHSAGYQIFLRQIKEKGLHCDIERSKQECSQGPQWELKLMLHITPFTKRNKPRNASKSLFFILHICSFSPKWIIFEYLNGSEEDIYNTMLLIMQQAQWRLKYLNHEHVAALIHMVSYTDIHNDFTCTMLGWIKLSCYPTPCLGILPLSLHQLSPLVTHKIILSENYIKSSYWEKKN